VPGEGITVQSLGQTARNVANQGRDSWEGAQTPPELSRRSREVISVMSDNVAFATPGACDGRGRPV